VDRQRRIAPQSASALHQPRLHGEIASESRSPSPAVHGRSSSPASYRLGRAGHAPRYARVTRRPSWLGRAASCTRCSPHLPAYVHRALYFALLTYQALLSPSSVSDPLVQRSDSSGPPRLRSFKHLIDRWLCKCSSRSCLGTHRGSHSPTTTSRRRLRRVRETRPLSVLDCLRSWLRSPARARAPLVGPAQMIAPPLATSAPGITNSAAVPGALLIVVVVLVGAGAPRAHA